MAEVRDEGVAGGAERWFPNLACVDACDDVIREELLAADIRVVPVKRRRSEVPYTLTGALYGWTFRRQWYYWVAETREGYGIPRAEAEALNARWFDVVRVAGMGSGAQVEKWLRRGTINSYHIDTPAGLRAFAKLLRTGPAEMHRLDYEWLEGSLPPATFTTRARPWLRLDVWESSSGWVWQATAAMQAREVYLGTEYGYDDPRWAQIAAEAWVRAEGEAMVSGPPRTGRRAAEPAVRAGEERGGMGEYGLPDAVRVWGRWVPRQDDYYKGSQMWPTDYILDVKVEQRQDGRWLGMAFVQALGVALAAPPCETPEEAAEAVEGLRGDLESAGLTWAKEG